jgi:hypothetical protein
MENLMERDYFGILSTEGKNSKIGLKETGCESVDWFHLVQDRVH